MTLATQATAALDPLLIARVRQAVITAAIAIENEGIVVARHASRIQMARNVLQSPASFANMLAEGVASQGFDNTATDVQINGAVTALWDAYAGGLP